MEEKIDKQSENITTKTTTMTNTSNKSKFNVRRCKHRWQWRWSNDLRQSSALLCLSSTLSSCLIDRPAALAYHLTDQSPA